MIKMKIKQIVFFNCCINDEEAIKPNINKKNEKYEK